MEENLLLEKNRKTIKVISWVILIAAAISVLSSMLGLMSTPFINSMQNSKLFHNKIEMNITAIILLNLTKMLISIFILLSAIFVLQYKEMWRRQIITGLILAIAYLMISPVISYYNYPTFHFPIDPNMPAGFLESAKLMSIIFSYFWSVAWSVFFIIAILKYRKEEIKLLFKPIV